MSKGRIDLVIKKVGEEWCLFSKDGTKKLGCHPSKEGAEAQERAIHSVVKDSETPEESGQMIRLFDSQMDLSNFIRLDDGSVRGDVRLAPESDPEDDPFVNGPSSFTLTEEEVDQAVQNFKNRGAPIPVTIGHHPDEDRQHQPAAAWIENIFREKRRDGNFLSATIRYLAETWTSIEAGKFMFNSMEFFPNGKDQKGNDIGFNLDGCAILNYPFFPLRIDNADPGGRRLITLGRLKTSKKEKNKMTRFRIYLQEDGPDAGKPEVKKGVTIKEVEGQFCLFDADGNKGKCFPTRADAEAAKAAMGGGGTKTPPAPPTPPAGAGKDAETIKKTDLAKLRKDSEELQRLKNDDPEKVELRNRVKTLEEKDTRNETRITAGRIRTAVSTLRNDHKVLVRLGDHNIEDDQGAVKFLESMPFGISTVEGLEKLAKDSDSCAHLPHVKLGSEAASGRDGITGSEELELGTEEGRAKAVRQRVINLRKEYGEDDLMTHCRGRRTTPEQMALDELKIENPDAWPKEKITA
jgi:hypothetical protein